MEVACPHKKVISFLLSTSARHIYIFSLHRMIYRIKETHGIFIHRDVSSVSILDSG